MKYTYVRSVQSKSEITFDSKTVQSNPKNTKTEEECAVTNTFGENRSAEELSS